MNNVFAKSLMSLALICYLFGASVAASHGLPNMQTVSDNVAMAAADMDTMSDCHQTMSDDPMPMAACKVFCAAMSNLVSMDSDGVADIHPVSTLIAFYPPNSGDSEPSMEPHPPK